MQLIVVADLGYACPAAFFWIRALPPLQGGQRLEKDNEAMQGFFDWKGTDEP